MPEIRDTKSIEKHLKNLGNKRLAQDIHAHNSLKAPRVQWRVAF